MSIVERALKRLQKTSPDAGSKASAEVTNIVRQRRQHREDVVLPELPNVKVRVPTETIDTPVQMLREEGVLAAEEHETILADQFRRIKWPVLESATGKAVEGQFNNVIMVTSSVAGEGKTFTSFNLALSIARERDVSVLLVDADVAKAHATRVLRSENRPGLTDVLAGNVADAEDLVLATGFPRLTFLPCGKRSDSVPELFASHRMAELVRMLGSADRSRIVLFDSSPLLATNEPQVLSRLVDQVILVVRAEHTPQSTLTEALSLLDREKEIRCILNQARGGDITEYYYGYGYGQSK